MEGKEKCPAFHDSNRPESEVSPGVRIYYMYIHTPIGPFVTHTMAPSQTRIARDAATVAHRHLYTGVCFVVCVIEVSTILLSVPMSIQ